MKVGVQNERVLFFQIHFGINLFSLIVGLFGVLALKFSIGIVEFCTLIPALLGIGMYCLNQNVGRKRRIDKTYYWGCCLTSVISLLFLSQLLFKLVVISQFSRMLYFLLTLIPICLLAYFILYGDKNIVYLLLNPIYAISVLVALVLLSTFIYNLIICNIFIGSFLVCISFIIGLLNLIIIAFICLDLRMMLYRGR
ncbi:MAG TPA: hypothetical protein DCY20_08090 [Firmicutes bacterium]|nr:hypothetical protein [Bacillota bacterium]